MKWFIAMDGPVCGVEEHAVIEADNEVEAEAMAHEMAVEHMQSYFDVVDDETDYDEDEWGHVWIRMEEVSSSVEEYVPEDHDMYIV